MLFTKLIRNIPLENIQKNFNNILFDEMSEHTSFGITKVTKYPGLAIPLVFVPKKVGYTDKYWKHYT